jgi:hypothetical protein
MRKRYIDRELRALGGGLPNASGGTVRGAFSNLHAALAILQYSEWLK